LRAGCDGAASSVSISSFTDLTSRTVLPAVRAIFGSIPPPNSTSASTTRMRISHWPVKGMAAA
jgi:hypothetical protein